MVNPMLNVQQSSVYIKNYIQVAINPTQILFSLFMLLDNNTGLKYLSGGVQNILINFKATERKK